jgi:hypothetical protein
MRSSAWIACLLLMITSSAWAGDLVFPFGPAYRVGKYFPVRVNGPVVLQAGQSRTVLRSSQPQIVPVLILDQNIDSLNGQPIRSLEPNEVLIAGAADPAELATVYPGRHVLLAEASPEFIREAFWGADGVIISDPDPAKIRRILACRTDVLLRNDHAPDLQFPWEHRGPFQLLRSWPASNQPPVLPAPSNPAIRVRVFVLGVIVALAIIAVVIFLNRAIVLWLVIVVPLAMVMIEVWRAHLPPTDIAYQQVVREGSPRQVEDWILHVPRAGRIGKQPWDPALVPIIQDPNQTITLNWDERVFEFDEPMLFVRRR